MPSHIGIVHGPAGSRRSGGAIPEPARSSGAIAILGQGGGRLGIVTLDVFDLPIRQPARAGTTPLADSAGPPELDLPRLAALLQIGALPAHAVIQQPSPRANQAASRVFARAQAHGAVLGVLAALRIQATPVYAAVWQRDMGVAAGPDAILARAGELFPDQLGKGQRARDVGRAYAAVCGRVGTPARVGPEFGPRGRTWGRARAGTVVRRRRDPKIIRRIAARVGAKIEEKNGESWLVKVMGSAPPDARRSDQPMRPLAPRCAVARRGCRGRPPYQGRRDVTANGSP